jgi:hypothetical protein
MKKIGLIILISLLFSGNLLALSAPEPIASITMSFGEVYIKPLNKQDWEITKVGMYVYEGDKMRTKDTGKAEVMFVNGSVVFLGNDTEMEFLQNEASSTNKNSLFLFFGSMWNKVTEGSDYSVESVHALATVRGTYFNVGVSDIMEVWVKEGLVDIENQYGKVEAGENSYVKVNESIAPIKDSIDSNNIPDEVSFESELAIEATIPTHIVKKEWHKVSGIVRIQDEKDLYTKPLDITISGTPGLVIKKSKKSKQEVNSLTIQPRNGYFEFYILSSETDESFTISSDKTISDTYYITASEEIVKKDVFVEFWNKNRELKRIKVTFEKQ